MRKCLQFEVVENHRMSIGCNRNSRKLTNDVSNAESPATPLNIGTINACYAEMVATSGNSNQFDLFLGIFCADFYLRLIDQAKERRLPCDSS